MPTKTVVEQLIIEIAGDSKKFKATVKEIEKENKRLGGSYKKLGVIAKATFAAVGSSAVLLGTVATKAFAEFETGVTNVAKTTNLAGKDLEDFKDEIIKMSERIPVTTDKLLEIATAAGQLGIKGAKDLSKFTEVIAKLGATTDLEGNDAALAIARILNLTNESVQSVDKLGSTLVDLGNNFAASESEILEVAKDVAKATVQFNLASDEILGISAAMASLGIASEAGGTVVGKAFQSIDQAIRMQTGPAFEKLIELTGLTGDVLNETFAKDASKVFQLFIQGLGRAGEEGKNLTAEMGELGLSGIRVNKILPTLAERSDILADSMERAGIASLDASALNEEAAKAFDTSASKLQIAQNKINNILVSIGEEIAPSVIEAVDSMAESAERSNAAWRALGLVFQGIISVVSGVVEVFGAFFKSIEDLNKAITGGAKKSAKVVKKASKDYVDNWQKAHKKRLVEQKKAGKKLTVEEQKRADSRLAKQKETNEIAAQEQEDADNEAFEEVESFTADVLEDLEIKNQQKLDEERMFRENFADLTDEARAKFSDKEKKALNDELKEIRAQRKTVSETKADAIIQEERQRTKAHNKFLADEEKFGTAMANLKKIQGSAEYQNVKTAAGLLATLTTSGNDELKAIGKAAAKVQITLSTVEGAAKAFNSLAWIFPPIGTGLGAIAAAALVVHGNSQLAEVDAMASGGIVSGTGNKDSELTLLTPGELVVPKDVTADLMKRLSARKMANGGVVNTGGKEKEGLDKTFNDIFGIPGIFLSLLGLDGGDSDTTASGFGAGFFKDLPAAMMGPLTEAADKMLEVMLSAIPGGPLIAAFLKETGLTTEDLAGLLGSGPAGDILRGLGLDDDVARAVIDLYGGATGIVGGVVGVGEDIIKGAGDLLGFNKGGFVPGNGGPDSVPAMLTPDELVIPKDFASSIGSISGGGMKSPSISGSSGGSAGGGIKTIHNTFEFSLNDNLIDVVSVGLRQKEIEGT